MNVILIVLAFAHLVTESGKKKKKILNYAKIFKKIFYFIDN